MRQASVNIFVVEPREPTSYSWNGITDPGSTMTWGQREHRTTSTRDRKGDLKRPFIGHIILAGTGHIFKNHVLLLDDRALTQGNQSGVPGCPRRIWCRPNRCRSNKVQVKQGASQTRCKSDAGILAYCRDFGEFETFKSQRIRTQVDKERVSVTYTTYSSTMSEPVYIY